ncbi:sterile alpha motif domain-containing protein 9-like [Centroberyx gerrardi]
MKSNFDYLDNFYVNLGSRCGMKDSREQVARMELFRCFKQYADLFCKTDSADLLKNKTMHTMLQVHHARQFLEMRKADTYCGILNCLSNPMSTEMMEKIARQYEFVLANAVDCSVKEKINFIYVKSIVLNCIKPGSRQLQPYQKLLDLLSQVLRGQIPLSDNLPLHFIAVALLWPQQHLKPAEPRSLGRYVSQMRTSYHAVMKEVCNGKRPVVHFFMGKKQGYERLVHLGELKRCVRAGQEPIASMWGNGKIWKEKEVEELLCRVTGEVQGNLILADTCIPDVKIEITPMFRSQLSGRAVGSKVSFFIGFSMKGPLAIDIN